MARIVPPQPTAAQIAADPALTSDWVVPTIHEDYATVAGFQVPRYRKWFGVVYLEGLVQVTADAGTSNPVYVLPAGFRPGADAAIAVYAAQPVKVDADGSVVPIIPVADNAIFGVACSFVAA